MVINSSKEIKLLLVVTGMPDVNGNGGSQFNLVYLRALIKKGIHVTVLHLRSISIKRKLYEEIEVDGVKRITVSCYNPPLRYGFKVYFLRSLFKLLVKNKHFNYNIIHGVGGGTVIASKILSKLGRVPFFLQFIGGDINFNLEKDLKRIHYVEAINKANLIAFNSKKLEFDFFLKSNMKVSSQVMYRGIDLNEFEFDYSSKTEIRILFLGGVSKHNEKGAFTIAEVCNKILINPIFKHKISFKLGGPNIQKILSEVKQVESENLSIQILGAISQDEVKHQMKYSNIVLIPSVSEGMPNVLFEAMATGNIVIATRVGGIPELVEHGVTGFLIDSQSSDEIIEVLKMLDMNPDNSKIALAARAVIEKYSYDSFVSFYINKYKKTLKLGN